MGITSNYFLLECNCPIATSTSCNSMGKCICEDNFAGLNCDECAPGRYGFPKCDKCVGGRTGPKCEKCDCERLFVSLGNDAFKAHWHISG